MSEDVKLTPLQRQVAEVRRVIEVYLAKSHVFDTRLNRRIGSVLSRKDVTHGTTGSWHYDRTEYYLDTKPDGTLTEAAEKWCSLNGLHDLAIAYNKEAIRRYVSKNSAELGKKRAKLAQELEELDQRMAYYQAMLGE